MKAMELWGGRCSLLSGTLVETAFSRSHDPRPRLLPVADAGQKVWVEGLLGAVGGCPGHFPPPCELRTRRRASVPSPPLLLHCTHGSAVCMGAVCLLTPGPGSSHAADSALLSPPAEPSKPPASIFARSLSATDIEVFWASPLQRSRGRIQGYEVSTPRGVGTGGSISLWSPPKASRRVMGHTCPRPASRSASTLALGIFSSEMIPLLQCTLEGLSRISPGPHP